MQLASKIWSAVASRGTTAVSSAPSNEDIAAYEDEVPMHVTAECVATLVGHEDRVWSVAWHPSRPLLASCGGDKTVRIWAHADAARTEWHLVATLEGEHQRTVRHVAWSANGTQLACSSFDATVTIWRLEDADAHRERDDDCITSSSVHLEVESVLEGHDNEVKCCAWADGSDALLATCSRDKTVWIWERPSTGEDEDPADFECGGVLSGHSQDVKSLCWLPSSIMPTGRRSLVSCSYDATMKLWEENPRRKDDWHCTQTMHHTALGTVWEVARDPSPHAKRLCSATEGGVLRMWCLNANNQWTSDGDTPVSERPVFSVDWQGPLIAAASGDNHLCFVHAARSLGGRAELTGTAESEAPLVNKCTVVGKVLNAHESDVNSVRFAPTLDAARTDAAFPTTWTLATGGDDNLVRIWRVTRSSGQPTCGADAGCTASTE